MSWLVTNVLATLLLPPLNFFLLGLAGLALLNRNPRLGRGLIVAMLALLWVFSTPIVSEYLLTTLERDAHTSPTEMRDAQAIVILGAGTYFDAPEYGGDTVGGSALERLRLAAMLHRKTGLPMLVTGGNPNGGTYPEGVLMKRVLEEELGVPVRWMEGASDNTWQNAYNSKKMLALENISNIALVTHGWHMPRSKTIFERAGFRVIPAGVAFHQRKVRSLLDFLPSAGGLAGSSVFMHEAIGMLWYSLKS